MTAAATLAGQVALPDREALVAQLAPVSGAPREAMRSAAERADERLAALLCDGRADDDPLGDRTLTVAGIASVRAGLDRQRGGRGHTDDQVAWLCLLLLHQPVRDYAWDRTDEEDPAIGLWTDVQRRAEPDLVAPPATLLAFAAWRAGRGALAAVALDRALGASPGYPMALLVEELIRGGVAPDQVDATWPPGALSR